MPDVPVTAVLFRLDGLIDGGVHLSADWERIDRATLAAGLRSIADALDPNTESTLSVFDLTPEEPK